MWVSVKEAAVALTVTPRAIRSACLRGSSRYTYRIAEGHGGKGRIYEIWREEEVKTTPEEPTTLWVKKEPTPVQLNAHERGMLKAKLCALADARDTKKSLSVWIEGLDGEFDPISPNVQKVRRWMREYRTAVSDGADVGEILKDNRGKPKGYSAALSEAMKALCESYLLRRDRYPTVMGIHAKLCELFSPPLPSLRSVERYIAQYKKLNGHLYAHATNPDRAKGRLKPAIGSASEAYAYNNCAWELDSTPADVMTRDGKRWTIYALIDVYSRRVVVTMEKSTSAFAVSRNLREGMLRLGLPELLITDNGRDYKNNHIDEMCIRMGIGKKEVPPFSGEMKPHVERFFGTLTRGLFKEMIGYVGANVAERQAIRSSKSFEQKLESIKKWKASQWSEEAFVKALLKSKEADLFVEVPLDSSELKHEINTWVQKYEITHHLGIGETPLGRWENGGFVRRVADARILDLLMGESCFKTVGKKGIVFTTNGVKTYYWGVALIPYVGMKVKVILPDDMAFVEVYDADTSTHICQAIDPAIDPEVKRSLIKETHKAYRKATARANKAVRSAESLGKVYDEKLHALKQGKNIPEVSTVVEVIEVPKTTGETLPKRYTGLVDRFSRRKLDGSWNAKDDQLAAENPDFYEIAMRIVQKTG